MQGQTVEQFLDSIQNSADSPQTKQIWETVKNQPVEQIAHNGKKLFYGVVGRALAGDTATLEELQRNPQLLAEVEAYIGCCFTALEQTQVQQSFSGSSRSRSSSG